MLARIGEVYVVDALALRDSGNALCIASPDEWKSVYRKRLCLDDQNVWWECEDDNKPALLSDLLKITDLSVILAYIVNYGIVNMEISREFLAVVRQCDKDGMTARQLVALFGGRHPDSVLPIIAILSTARWYRQAGCTRLTLDDFSALVDGRNPNVQQYVRRELERIFTG